MHLVATLLLAAAATTSGSEAAPANATRSSELRVKCIISAIHEVEVPAKRVGALMSLSKREGQEVEKGAVVANIDDQDARARVRAAEFRQQQARLQAENVFRIQAAEKAAEAASYEHKQSVQINNRSPGAVSEFEIKRSSVQAERLGLTAKSEKLAVEEASYLEQERQQEILIATNDLHDRKVRSPINGIVAELLRHDGEWLRQGEPIMRIIQMDVLKAEAYVSLNDVLPFEVAGRTVSILWRVGNGKPQIFENCRISFVSPEVEPGGRYRVWADVPNRRWKGSNQWILRPGMVAEMVFRYDSGETSN